jgi:hypothetical protein
MQSQASSVLALVRIANAVERKFPLRFRIDGTTATSYFETDAARSQKAAELVSSGVAVVFMPLYVVNKV